jgi:D-alanyl-D-alanine carboxypeptidase
MAVHKQRLAPRQRIGAAAWAAGLLALLVAFAVPRSALAEEKNAILIVDGNTGRTLYESSADALRHPASLAKMMTLYLVFEQIEQGRLTYQSRIKVSAAAAAAQPSKLELNEGDEIVLIDAIRALITKSANDVAVAVAEQIAGSEARFARLMNQKAAQLGMKNTLFKNASGLPDDEQVTTARDMVTLALHLQDDFPKHYPLFATPTFTYNGDTFRNHNNLLANYEGTEGVKTGYTAASGFNLVASVHRGQKHVVGAVFGGASASQRDHTMRTFLNIGLVKASHIKTRVPAPALVAARGKGTPAAKIAGIPMPQRVERPATIKPVIAAEAGDTSQSGSATTSQGVEIARVRPVLVTPRPAVATGTPDSIDTVLERGGPEQTAQLPQWTTASASGSFARAPAFAPADKPALFNDPAVARGTLPSTLEDQAARLAAGTSAVGGQTLTTQSLSEPQAKPRLPAQGQVAAASVGGFHIQIGAYQSLAEAEHQLAAVRERAAAVLRSYAAVTLQFRQGDKVLHRARFSGFDAQAAASTCNELKRLKVDCMVVKAE